MWAVIGLAFVVLAVVTVMVYRRYGETHHLQRDWQRTDEVFKDPSTGRLMRVWLDPSDGTRHYLPD